MTHRALAALAALAFLYGGAAVAQDAPAMDEEFTVDTVSKDDPFGEIEVNAAELQQVEAIANFAQTLNEEQREELTARCEVVTANADAGYSEDAVAFCNMWAP